MYSIIFVVLYYHYCIRIIMVLVVYCMVLYFFFLLHCIIYYFYLPTFILLLLWLYYLNVFIYIIVFMYFYMSIFYRLLWCLVLYVLPFVMKLTEAQWRRALRRLAPPTRSSLIRKTRWRLLIGSLRQRWSSRAAAMGQQLSTLYSVRLWKLSETSNLSTGQ